MPLIKILYNESLIWLSHCYVQMTHSIGYDFQSFSSIHCLYLEDRYDKNEWWTIQYKNSNYMTNWNGPYQSWTGTGRRNKSHKKLSPTPSSEQLVTPTDITGPSRATTSPFLRFLVQLFVMQSFQIYRLYPTSHSERQKSPIGYLYKLSVMKQHEINVWNLGMLQYCEHEQSNMAWLLQLIQI